PRWDYDPEKLCAALDLSVSLDCFHLEIPFPPLDNPEITIRRRSRTDPAHLNNSEMAAEGPGDDANTHLDKFLHVTQSFKVNGVTDDALRLYLFPHSLTHHVTAWFNRLPRNSINTLENMAKMFLGK
nr:reverse transcriptase domain-containing protein [Tanacetum cinerariifolium]